MPLLSPAQHVTVLAGVLLPLSNLLGLPGNNHPNRLDAPARSINTALRREPESKLFMPLTPPLPFPPPENDRKPCRVRETPKDCVQTKPTSVNHPAQNVTKGPGWGTIMPLRG